MRYIHGLAEKERKPIYRAWSTAKYWSKKKNLPLEPGWEYLQNFLDDMAPSFYLHVFENGEANTRLIRKDITKGYTKENCFWGTNKQNFNPITKPHFLTYKGKTANLSEWSKIIGLSVEGLTKRLKLGWSVEDALTLPPFPYGKYLKTHLQEKVIPPLSLEEDMAREEWRRGHEKSDGAYKKALEHEVAKGRMTKKEMREYLKEYEENKDRYNSTSIQLAVQANRKLRPKGINKKGYQFGINRQGI